MYVCNLLTAAFTSHHRPFSALPPSPLQVMKAKIAVVAVVAGRAKVFGRKTVAAVLPTIVDKLGDAKVGGVVWE